jgi:hypothetical protein
MLIQYKSLLKKYCQGKFRYIKFEKSNQSEIMTNQQWQLLLDTAEGKTPEKPVTGFIIDSP